MKIAIIGAGPAGLTAAYQLSKNKQLQVELFEASEQVGGMSRTISLWGQRVDLGPHRFFSNDTRVNELWLEVIGKDYQMVDRLTRIYYKKKFYYYPLKAFDALYKLGVWEATRCVWSYFLQRFAKQTAQDDFETWVTSRFGKRLFEIFFKTYSEKLWGIPCTELDADFAAQRIKKLSLFEAIKNALWSSGTTKHKTLVDQFAYPLYGTGQVYEKMLARFEKNGGTVFLNTPVKRVINEGTKAKGIELMSGECRYFDHIVSSMPLTHVVKQFNNVSPELLEKVQSLRFRNTILVYLLVDGVDLFKDNWLYIHSNDLQMGRVTNFRNWLPTLYGDKQQTVLALEYWCYFEDDIWSEKDEILVELAKTEMRKTGLVKDFPIVDGCVFRIPRCYPVYHKGYKNQLQPVEAFLKTFSNISFVGRYGAFKYNNQDHSILMGLLAAENISQNAQHDLWEINTDYESYQESSIISETGLVKQ